MENQSLFRNTENLKNDLLAFGGEIKKSGKSFICAEGYQISDSMAEYEALDPRTDIFSSMNSFESFGSLHKSLLSNYKLQDASFNALFDEMLARLLAFLEGNSMISLFFSCVLIHDIDVISNPKRIEFAILSSYSIIVHKLFVLANNTGLRNHDDLYLSYMPQIKFFEESLMRTSFDSADEQYKSDCLKSNSLITREKTVGNEFQCEGRPLCTTEVSETICEPSRHPKWRCRQAEAYHN